MRSTSKRISKKLISQKIRIEIKLPSCEISFWKIEQLIKKYPRFSKEIVPV